MPNYHYHLLSSKSDRKNRLDEDGFSLMEIVIAVSIMLIIAVLSIIAYQGFTDKAREAAVESAASEVMTSALSEYNKPNGKSLSQLEQEYNESSYDELNVSITENDGITVTARGWMNRNDGEGYVATRTSTSEGSSIVSPEDEEDSESHIVNIYQTRLENETFYHDDFEFFARDSKNIKHDFVYIGKHDYSDFAYYQAISESKIESIGFTDQHGNEYNLEDRPFSDERAYSVRSGPSYSYDFDFTEHSTIEDLCRSELESTLLSECILDMEYFFNGIGIEVEAGKIYVINVESYRIINPED